MIDIHCHLLPGIDDGAKTIEESVEFCRMAELDGIRTIVATPHMRYDTFPNTAEGIQKAHASLSARLEREEVPVRLILGAEVHLAPDLADRFRSGDLITYGGVGKFLLLELPYQQFPARVEEMVFQFRLLGVTPVLAHPERIAFFLDDSTRLGRLIELGALTQFTASSITGKFGGPIQSFCREMFEKGWVDTIASDAHDLRHRPPILSSAMAVVKEWAGEEAANRVVEGTPRGIIEGKSPDSFVVRRPPDRPPARRKWWFRRGRSGGGA